VILQLNKSDCTLLHLVGIFININLRRTEPWTLNCTGKSCQNLPVSYNSDSQETKIQVHLTWGTAKQFSAQLERIWLSICHGDKTFDIKLVLENDTRFAQHSSGDNIRWRHPYLNIKCTQLFPEFNKIWDVTERLSDPRQYQISQKSVVVVVVFVLGLLHVGATVAQWLRCRATNRKVACSIPAGVSRLFIDIKSFPSHYGPGVDSASNKNEYQEYFLGVKSGRCVRLTTY
jgi:hypothetical protein